MFAPRPNVQKPKSGTVDITDSYQRRMIRWRDSILHQALLEMQSNREFQEIKRYIDFLDGTWWASDRPSYRSKFYDNFMADVRRESLSSLSDIRPAIDISCKVKDYKQQSNIAHGIIRAEWYRQKVDLALIRLIDHALFGTGYVKIVAGEPGFMGVTAHGPDTVLPILMSEDGNIQTAAAVAYRGYRPITYFQNKFGTEKAKGLERYSTTMGLHSLDGQYDRPDAIPEYCLAPDALVQDADGSILPIKDWDSRFNLTVDSSGAVVPARLKMSQRTSESTVNIKTWGTFGDLPTTADHKYLTPSGFVRADELKVGDFVRRPVRAISHTQKQIVFQERGGGRRKNGSEFSDVSVDATYDLGWLFGFYLAEGTVQEHADNNPGCYSRVFLAIDEDERDSSICAIRRALGGGQKVGEYKHKDSRTLVLRIDRASVARFIGHNFGRAEGKKIPTWVWDCGKDFCRGIVAGYIGGDGHLRPGDNAIIASSIYPAISFQVRELLLSLGCGLAKIDFAPGGDRYGRNCRDSYVLRTNSIVGKNLRDVIGWPVHQTGRPQDRHPQWAYSAGHKHVDVAIENVSSGFAEEFYDLVVDTDRHDFLTIHGTVHNSWNSMSPAMRRHKANRGGSIARMAGGESPFPIIPYTEIYYDDWTVNEGGHDILVKHPDLDVTEHNYHYIVPMGARMYPRKRLVIFGGDRVMYDGPSPFWSGLYPFSMLQLNPCVWSIGGISKYRDLIPLCYSVNRAGAGVDETVMAAVNRNVVSRRGAIAPADWDRVDPSRPNQKILLNGQADPTRDFRWMDPPQLPAYVLQFLQHAVDRINKKSGALDISGLSRKRQTPGGDAIENMRDSMSAPFRLEGRYVESCLVDIGVQAVSHSFQFYTLDQRMRYLGEDGLTWEDFDYKSASMVPAFAPKEDHWKLFPVNVAPGSMHGSSKQQAKVEAFTLYRSGGLSLRGLYRAINFNENVEQVMKEIAEERQMGIGAPAGRSPRQSRSQKTGSPV